jgi:predicted HNH restriction endonuclease
MSIERACPICSTVYSASPTRLAWGRETTCSKACSYELRAKAKSNQVQRVCIGCGELFERCPSHLDRNGKGKYCSRKCRDLYRVNTQHPQYINGSASESRGPNWQAQKRKAKQRDRYICQRCGIDQQGCVAKFGQTFQVHHITPFRLCDDYIQANQLSNLITLCPRCHRIAEAQYQQLERGAA